MPIPKIIVEIINDFLAGLMYGIGIKLVDFKIEVGLRNLQDP